MNTLSQTLFVFLKGASYGFPTLVIAGVVAFFAYTLFSRSHFKYAALWAGIAALLLLGGMLYVDEGQALIQLSLHATNTVPATTGLGESGTWLDFIAKAGGGVIGILAGLKLRMRFWPASGSTADSCRPA